MSNNPGVRAKVTRPSSPTLTPRTSKEDYLSIPTPKPANSNAMILGGATGIRGGGGLGGSDESTGEGVRDQNGVLKSST